MLQVSISRISNQEEKRRRVFTNRVIKEHSMKVLKQVSGIDVAQKELVVSLGRMNENLITEVYAFKTFSNTEKGFIALVQWVTKLTAAEIPVRYVMEATGVYHETLAYYLADNGHEVSILMPNKMSNFSKTLETKTITDKTASQAIALFGLEKQMSIWQKPKQVYRELRQVTRERGQLIEERTALKNQLHAEQSQAYPNKKSLERIQVRIKLLDSQVEEIMKEITVITKQDKEIGEIIKRLCTVPGVALLTATIILAETNGFDLITNIKQLISFAGLDVKEKQSGTSVKGKPKISKKGNRHLRKAMHFPALTAIRHDERYKAIFARLVGKHGIKMKAAVAVQRKLLEMTYIVYKTNKPYDKGYLKKQKDQAENKEAA
jgi:transposase